MHKTAIIIPAYNESLNIIDLIKKIKKNLKSLIIIVDDSNNFLTKDVIKKKKFKNLIYIKRKKKLGRGSAVITGFRKAFLLDQIKCFIEMDADMSHNPDELNNHVKLFFNKKLDLLIASRYLKTSKIYNWPLSRRLLSKCSNFLTNYLLKLKFNDLTNGFRFYSRRSIKIILNNEFINQDFLILTEIVLKLHQKNLKIEETPTIFKNRIRGESSVNFQLIYSSLKSLIKLYLNAKNFKKN